MGRQIGTRRDPPELGRAIWDARIPPRMDPLKLGRAHGLVVSFRWVSAY